MRNSLAIILSLALALTLCACGTSPSQIVADAPTWQEQYDLGVRYLSEGNYEEAIIAFSAAIEIDPKRAEGYMRLAEAYEAIGETENALEVLRSGLEATGDVALSALIEDLTGRMREEESTRVIEKLMANYPKVRSEQFVTCVAADFPSLPDWSSGLISSHQVDVDLDGVAEAILTRADEEHRIFVDIYDITGEEPSVCSSTEITSFSYCDQIDVELFYNTVLNCWCITVDSGYSGAYTGAYGYALALYKIEDRGVSLGKSWDWNSVVMMFEDNNIVSEAEQSGVNYLSCQETNLDQRTPENQYHELVRIQSEVLSGDYPPEYTWGMTIFGNATQKAKSTSASSPASIPAATAAPSQPGRDRVDLAPLDCIGMTINDMAATLGSDYQIAEYWLSGCAKGLYYNDNRTPLYFYYMDEEYTGQPTGEEEIAVVEYVPTSDCRIDSVIPGVSSYLTYSQLTDMGYSGIVLGSDDVGESGERAIISFEYKEKYGVAYSWFEDDPFTAPAELISITKLSG